MLTALLPTALVLMFLPTWEVLTLDRTFSPFSFTMYVLISAFT